MQWALVVAGRGVWLAPSSQNALGTHILMSPWGVITDFSADFILRLSQGLFLRKYEISLVLGPGSWFLPLDIQAPLIA